MNDGKYLRASIFENLGKLLKDNIKINKVCELDLRVQDIEKIISYGYLNLTYF